MSGDRDPDAHGTGDHGTDGRVVVADVVDRVITVDEVSQP